MQGPGVDPALPDGMESPRAGPSAPRQGEDRSQERERDLPPVIRIVLQHPEFAAATAVGMVALTRSAGLDPTEFRQDQAKTYEPRSAHHEMYERANIQFRAAFTTYLSICEALSHE